jgi:hypothetical protein
VTVDAGIAFVESETAMVDGEIAYAACLNVGSDLVKRVLLGITPKRGSSEGCEDLYGPVNVLSPAKPVQITDGILIYREIKGVPLILAEYDTDGSGDSEQDKDLVRHLAYKFIEQEGLGRQVCLVPRARHEQDRVFVYRATLHMRGHRFQGDRRGAGLVHFLGGV